ncbi:unnamed protein product [Effrenium voratum]|uniref:Uncharacterized protein n=1 Tax=Effrenium voratum TaxID=2562239 RepID=A0AA36HKT1_9DINO|nr:unnamed protein product [Effrenium voratum]
MVASKLCSFIAVVHFACALLMFFKPGGAEGRWGAHELETPLPEPQIALGAIGINAKLGIKVEAMRRKLRAADRQAAWGFLLLAFWAQDLAMNKHYFDRFVDGKRFALALLLWHGMLLFNYVSPSALISSRKPLLTWEEMFFVVIAQVVLASSIAYLVLLLVYWRLSVWLEWWRMAGSLRSTESTAAQS